MEEVYEKRGYLLEDFRLFHLKDNHGTNVDYHYHEFCKLLLLLSGSGSYVIEGRRYTLKAGDVVLIGSRCVHKPEFESGVSYERLILYISPAFLAHSSVESCDLLDCFDGSKGHVLRPGDELRRRLHAMTAELENEMSSDSFGREIVSRGILLHLLVELSRALQKNDVSLPCPTEPRDGKILDILRYLDNNLTEEVSIDDLSARFYISKYHMMRRFRKETGTSIHNYLSDKRLMLAKELIGKGVAATDACFQSGFHSYSAFSRAYGKLFGVTPTGRQTMSPLEAEADE